MSQKIRCANPNCRRLFLPDPRVKGQRYCSKEECRRVRKRQWQRQKIKDDLDYRDNQRDAQQCWMEQNRDYWRRYRDQHPGYVKRNRLLQRERDRGRRLARLAKMDAPRDISSIKPGSYYLIPAKRDLAKMDALSPKYFLIPQTYPFLAKKDSMDLFSFSDLGCTKKEVAAQKWGHILIYELPWDILAPKLNPWCDVGEGGMARPWTIEYHGAYYHILSHGNEGRRKNWNNILNHWCPKEMNLQHRE